MPKAVYKSLLDASLEDVWALHADAEEGLTALSPPEAEVEVVKADPAAVGAEVILKAKTPIGRKTWHAVYREFQPIIGHRPHREAWFVDEALKSPFKAWRHRHHFQETVVGGKVKVVATDTVTYTPPLGPLGMIGNVLIVRPQLNKMFRYRHGVYHERFGGKMIAVK